MYRGSLPDPGFSLLEMVIYDLPCDSSPRMLDEWVGRPVAHHFEQSDTEGLLRTPREKAGRHVKLSSIAAFTSYQTVKPLSQLR